MILLVTQGRTQIYQMNKNKKWARWGYSSRSYLNPIENAWTELKDRIYTLYPDLESFDGSKEQLKKQFHKTIEKTCESLGDYYSNPLIKSMVYRVNEVLETMIWYTSY